VAGDSSFCVQGNISKAAVARVVDTIGDFFLPFYWDRYLQNEVMNKNAFEFDILETPIGRKRSRVY